MENPTATLRERQQEIKQVVDLEVIDMLAAANEAGYSTSETLAALENTLAEQKHANAEDYNPGDDQLS